MINSKTAGILIAALFTPFSALAETQIPHEVVDLTGTGYGVAAITIFTVAYMMVMCEECMNLRKSKPVMIAAGMIWGMLGYYYMQHGMPEVAKQAVRHNLLEYAELMLFLLVAMSYVNAMDERRVFIALRNWLINKGYGFRKLFWLTGILTFFISPVADNLTTALLMCAVVVAVGGDNTKFITLACVNIVVAANAGGAFSPFGDITTLMVWQRGIIDFWTFFALFIPSAVNAFVPASFMHFAVPVEHPGTKNEVVMTYRGAKRIIGLFLLTICTAVCFHNFLGLPPVIGMLAGLGYLQFMGYYLKKTHYKCINQRCGNVEDDEELGNIVAFDVFRPIARAEWDTLLFFYGVILCVGGLGFMGYLVVISETMYLDWGPTSANIIVGILSAIVDNIPVMVAVIAMSPDMSTGQWLLVTLTAGVGGSLLSIGSAAGVALMGQAQGKYTFFGHLKWTPVIALGYAASIATHMWINSAYF